MPAIRSRTEHWLDNLKKVQERGGALEISVNRAGGGDAHAEETGTDVVWRVRVVRITDQHVVVEPPAAFGTSINLDVDIALIGAMTIGQNRWMFHTRTLGYINGQRPNERFLLLALPERVERCTRRSFFRISTANLKLPGVECWPLIDPTSVVAAEAANRVEIRDMLSGAIPLPPVTPVMAPLQPPTILPDVGPMFRANLLNVSGGGLGLMVAPGDAAALGARPYLWIRLDLRPHIPAPAAVTARVAHTHTDSSQHVYAGLAFDFAHNPPHRKFIVDLFGQYIDALQRQQKAMHRPAA